MGLLQELADTQLLGALMTRLFFSVGRYELVAHWTQGEFHHDLVFQLSRRDERLPGCVLVVSTNCNGGVKEVLTFDEVPDRWALWHWRCPENEAFEGDLPTLLSRASTTHWFDPCELLTPDARSELRPEHRTRQRGGGWVPRGSKDDSAT